MLHLRTPTAPLDSGKDIARIDRLDASSLEAPMEHVRDRHRTEIAAGRGEVDLPYAIRETLVLPVVHAYLGARLPRASRAGAEAERRRTSNLGMRTIGTPVFENGWWLVQVAGLEPLAAGRRCDLSELLRDSGVTIECVERPHDVRLSPWDRP